MRRSIWVGNRGVRIRKRPRLGIGCLVLVLVATAWTKDKAEKQLSPQNAEFLSQVRYIITKNERKDFLALPDSQRAQFIEEFWKRRDPDPATEENEFKTEYYKRIETANQLFSGEGRPGWLTDRGRIYILFGPPQQRSASPLTRDAYGRCREVWYYGTFPVIFMDTDCSGNFVLETLNLEHLPDLNAAQAGAQNTIVSEDKPRMEFDLVLRKNVQVTSRVEALVELDIPIRSIWFSSEGNRLATTFDVEIKISDREGAVRWKYKNSYNVSLPIERIKESQKSVYQIRIPFIVDQDVDAFRKGKNKIVVTLQNRTGNEKLRKVAEFTV